MAYHLASVCVGILLEIVDRLERQHHHHCSVTVDCCVQFKVKNKEVLVAAWAAWLPGIMVLYVVCSYQQAPITPSSSRKKYNKQRTTTAGWWRFEPQYLH
jgi:uncharacterized membrane protein YdcZ (DUF606 family)